MIIQDRKSVHLGHFMDEHLQEITEIMRDLFDEFDGPVTRETGARDVEQWDSLAHVQLMVLVEKTFDVKFSSQELNTFRNIGELIDAIKVKQAK